MVSVFQQQESAVVGAGRDAARLPPMPHSVAARPRGCSAARSCGPVRADVRASRPRGGGCDRMHVLHGEAARRVRAIDHPHRACEG